MPLQTRQRIVHILEERETATIRELSRSLKLTPANIRHHISILINQGSVQIAGYKDDQLRGRPSAVYALVKPSLKDNLDLLSSILLKDLQGKSAASSQEDLLRWLAKSLAAEFIQTTHNPTQRLYASIQTLNRLNYHAQWEARVDSPRIMFGHCPYAVILDNHPEMCQVDSYLVEYLTGESAQLIAKRVLTADGRRQCLFRITQK